MANCPPSHLEHTPLLPNEITLVKLQQRFQASHLHYPHTDTVAHKLWTHTWCNYSHRARGVLLAMTTLLIGICNFAIHFFTFRNISTMCKQFTECKKISKYFPPPDPLFP